MDSVSPAEREHDMEQLQAEQQRAEIAEAAQEYLQNIIDTGREPFLVLDAWLCVVSANRAFYQTFQTAPEDTQGRLVYALGDGQWNIAALRALLEDVLPNGTSFDGVRVDHTFPHIGPRSMLLNARKVYRPGNHSQLIFLSLQDITERLAAETLAADALARAQQEAARARRIAEALQRPLMVETPEDAFPGLSVATLYSSAWAESEVGGDFYDAIPLADGRVAFLVGDASGKGLAAAARATEVKDVLRAFLRVYPYYPALTLTRLNDYLCDLQSLDDRAHDTFVALSLVVVNLKKSEAVLAWAGIEAPILVRAGNGMVERVTGGGLPLGASTREVYVDATVRFAPGDLLVLSTDGLSEARSGKDFLGQDGVDELVQSSLSLPSLRGMGEAVLSDARGFAGGALQDDACLVLVRRL